MAVYYVDLEINSNHSYLENDPNNPMGWDQFKVAATNNTFYIKGFRYDPTFDFIIWHCNLLNWGQENWGLYLKDIQYGGNGTFTLKNGIIQCDNFITKSYPFIFNIYNMIIIANNQFFLDRAISLIRTFIIGSSIITKDFKAHGYDTLSIINSTVHISGILTIVQEVGHIFDVSISNSAFNINFANLPAYCNVIDNGNNSYSWIPPVWPSWNSQKEAWSHFSLGLSIPTPPQPGLLPYTSHETDAWGYPRLGIGAFYMKELLVLLSETPANVHKSLSGIEWLTQSNSINISSTCKELALKTYRNTDILKIEWNEFGKDDEWFDAENVFAVLPPNKLDQANINTSISPINSFLIGSNNYVTEDDNAKLTVRYFDPHGNNTDDTTPAYNIRIDTYNADLGSNELIENFTGESYRFKKSVVDSNLNDNTVTLLDGSWDSTDDISGLIDGEYSLQVAYKKLIYPNRNYTNTIPIGLDYSILTGERTFYRLFEGIGPFNGGTITFEGLENAKDEIIDKSNIEVFLHLPGVTEYHFGGGFENGNIFQDLGIYQNLEGGCLSYNGGSGESVNFSFNTISSDISNYKCFIKIKIKNTNIEINKIIFNPTYA